MAEDSSFSDEYLGAWLRLVAPDFPSPGLFFSLGPRYNQLFAEPSSTRYQSLNLHPDQGELVQFADEKMVQIGKSILSSRGPELIQAFPSVTAVAVSLKFVHGQIMPNQPCITFFVKKKLGRQRIGGKSVPTLIEGVPTDVIEAGTPRLLRSPVTHTPGLRLRPAQPGTSTSHVRVSSGTFGCLVEDEAKQYVLSCAHVLADATGMHGDPIVQPATYFGGTAATDLIARFTKMIPLRGGSCKADAAIAEVSDTSAVTADVRGVGKPTGSHVLSGVGLLVQKSGDATGVTHGVVTGIKGTVGPLRVNGVANVYFSNVIITTGMSDPGDSGSLLMDYRNRGIGVLFGGLQYGSSYVVSWYSPIDVILQSLSVRLVT